jgi:threonine aldolase
MDRLFSLSLNTRLQLVICLLGEKMRRLGMPIYSQKDWLTRLQASKYVDGPIDIYNQQGRVVELEKRVAALLNKPASLFFPKGTIAQLCAMKVSAEQRKDSNVVLHSMSHMILDEDDAYQTVMGLNGIPIGGCDSPFDINDIQAIEETFATVSIELPIRRAGFKLTPWKQLETISYWCRAEQIHLHMDGARLWESACAYQKSVADISQLFDSVYVSMYKGLGAMGGAVLAGETEFIDACKVWRSRLGGNAFTSFPMVIGALDGLDNRLKHIPECLARATEIAKLLTRFPRLEVNVPQTNGFLVFLEGDLNELTKKSKQLNKKMDLQLFSQFSTFPNTHKHMIEMQVGADHQAISDKEIIEYFTLLLV